MEYIIVAFRSRQTTLKFYQFLKTHGYYAEVVNTPKKAGVGCGLSVKVSENMLGVVKKGVRMGALPQPAGVFKVKKVGGELIVRSI